MSTNEVRSKVLQWLNETYGGVELRDDDRIFVPGFGSTVAFVKVDDLYEYQRACLTIDAPILLDVPITKELYEYIGYSSNDFMMGNFAMVRAPGATRVFSSSGKQCWLIVWIGTS